MTSVSMTINGPAPMLLAYFMNAAIDQECEKYINKNGLTDLCVTNEYDGSLRLNKCNPILATQKWVFKNMPNGPIGSHFFDMSSTKQVRYK